MKSLSNSTLCLPLTVFKSKKTIYFSAFIYGGILNGHKFVQTLGYSGVQRSPACYSPWGCKELDVT